MSEAEKDGTVPSPNDQVEADQISTDDLDAVAGGVLSLQQVDGGEGKSEAELSSLLSVGCCLSDSELSNS